MRTIGTYEAKTTLPELLHQVEAGETVTITRNGKPVAKLVPIESESSAIRAKDIVRALRGIRSRAKKGNPSIKSLIRKGRRF